MRPTTQESEPDVVLPSPTLAILESSQAKTLPDEVRSGRVIIPQIEALLLAFLGAVTKNSQFNLDSALDLKAIYTSVIQIAFVPHPTKLSRQLHFVCQQAQNYIYTLTNQSDGYYGARRYSEEIDLLETTNPPICLKSRNLT